MRSTKMLAVIWMSLAVTAVAHAATTAYPDKPIRLVIGSAPGSGPDIIARFLSERLYKSWNQRIVVDARPAKATLSMNEHVKSVDMGALLKASLDTTRIAGKGNANAQLTASGNTDVAMFKSLAGKIDFDIKDGAINGVDRWYEIRRALALFKQQAAPTRDASIRSSTCSSSRCCSR